ncbi:nuclear export factor GLE1 [Actinobacteria bacterium OK074]|nr:nuclear export factor GLE1 [Actinobacteria bacterium OK074]
MQFPKASSKFPKARLGAAGIAAATAVLALAGPASAHVSVEPEGTAPQGGYAIIDFRVPNERDDASTTKLEVSFPTDTPFVDAMPQPVEGWKAKVTTTKLDKPVTVSGQQIEEAVSKVTWTATGKGIEPGYFQKFPLAVGPLPAKADEVAFKALQTYDNKEVVRWIEVQQEGAAEPENPAPVLTLTAATAADGHHGSATAEDAAEETSTTAAADTTAGSDGSDTTARVLAVVGIVVGAAGVAYGVLAGRRRTTTEA